MCGDFFKLSWVEKVVEPDGIDPYFDLLVLLTVSANTYLPISGVGPSGIVTADFGHTATLALILPTGFTFLSDSGVFLGPSGSSGPLPATLPLMLGGLAGISLLGPLSRRGSC
jgi:hypothetical protein